MSMIENFERLLAGGKDSALLRFSLGNEYAKVGRHVESAAHLRVAVILDPHYSAAWKLLGRALASTGEIAEARIAYTNGVAAAQLHGDKQAAKEMQVFLRRLNNSTSPPT